MKSSFTHISKIVLFQYTQTTPGEFFHTTKLIFSNRIYKAKENVETVKVEILQEKVERRSQIMNRFYTQLTSNTAKIFESCTQTTNRIYKKAVTECDSGDKDSIMVMFNHYQQHLHEIVCENNKFLAYIDLCISCTASLKEYKMTESLNSICNATLDLITSYGEFRK